MQSNESVQFELVSGTRTVDTNTLEKIKAGLDSLGGPEFPARFQELRDSMRAELKSSTVWINEGHAGIGVWRLEGRNGLLVLVHYPPPRKGTSYLYNATLEPGESGWKVVSFEQERELGPG